MISLITKTRRIQAFQRREKLNSLKTAVKINRRFFRNTGNSQSICNVSISLSVSNIQIEIGKLLLSPRDRNAVTPIRNNIKL